MFIPKKQNSAIELPHLLEACTDVQTASVFPTVCPLQLTWVSVLGETNYYDCKSRNSYRLER